MNIVSTDNVTNYIGKNDSSSSSMDSDEFLQVLVTQLENQNPLEPMNDVEYITQVVQFSMLDGINSLNTEFGQDKAVGYIGKNVIGTVSVDDYGRTQLITGQVKSVSFIEGKVLLNLDDSSLYLENVLEVSE